MLEYLKANAGLKDSTTARELPSAFCIDTHHEKDTSDFRKSSVAKAKEEFGWAVVDVPWHGQEW
jgi:hypothetical protein